MRARVPERHGRLDERRGSRGEHLGTYDARVAGRGADADREHLRPRRRPEDRHEQQREQERREGEGDLEHKTDRTREQPSAERCRGAQDHGETQAHGRGPGADEQRLARAPHDAAVQIATRLIRSEPVGERRSLKGRGEVVGRRRMGGEHGRPDGGEQQERDEREGDHEPHGRAPAARCGPRGWRGGRAQRGHASLTLGSTTV